MELFQKPFKPTLPSHSTIHGRRIAVGLVFAIGCLIAPVFGEDLYKDPNVAAEARARDVVARLTLPEKLTLNGGGKGGMSFPGVPRLGLNSARMADASQGIRLMTRKKKLKNAQEISEAQGVAGDDTVSVSFPGMMPLAGTWDTALAREFGEAMGEQCRALGVDILLGPGINMYRTSAGGRAYEYMGEDPLLTSRTAVAYVKGVQSKGVVATAKHFVANDTEFCRHFSSSEVDMRTLREIYLMPWQAVIEEAHVGAIMTGNNQINGIPACMNKPLLQDILRNEWGFNGMCMSDWQQTTYYTDKHDLVLASGHSLYMPVNDPFRKWFEQEYQAHPEKQAEMAARLDEMVAENLTPLFSSGCYDREQSAPQKGADFSAHQDIARRTAEGAICLLKNEGDILPVKPGSKILYLGDTEIYTGKGSGRVEGFDHKSYETALQQTFGDAITFTSAKLVTPQQYRAADVVIYNINRESGEGQDVPFDLDKTLQDEIERVVSMHSNVVVLATACNGFDMPWLGKVKGLLWCYFLGQERGTALAEIISGNLSPSGKLPMTIEKRFADSVDPEYNFIGGKPFWRGDLSYRSYWLGGKVPEQSPVEIVQQFIPNVKPHEVLKVPYKEGIFMGYRWYDKQKIEPRFPFGYGLSYTTFAYEELKLERSKVEEYPVTAIVTVKNTGKVAGKEVVQVYATDVQSSVEQPVKELAGFVKVDLKPGEIKSVEIPLHWSAFQFFDVVSNHWKLEPGEFIIRAGGSSSALPLQQSIEL